MTEAEERELRISVMKADLDLKTKQAAWETPRNIALMAAAVAGIVGTLAGVIGFQLGRREPPAPQIIFQPGAIQLQAPRTD